MRLTSKFKIRLLFLLNIPKHIVYSKKKKRHRLESFFLKNEKPLTGFSNRAARSIDFTDYLN